MTEDRLSSLTATAFVVVFALGIIAMCFAIYQGSVQRDKCLAAGGVPIDRQCVKPNSFIEVK